MLLKKCLAIIVLFSCFNTYAQIEEQQLDDLIKKTLTTFDVPGISVGISITGKYIFPNGLGLRYLPNKKHLNETT